jgi:asparagine synthase (glutamine-hydrolysing)
MPGIVGLITKMPRERAERELLQMIGTLRHEDFYVTGTLTDEPLGVYVGWVAREDAFDEGMPLRNERGDVLIFSGEEFPVPGTQHRLQACGHDLDPNSAQYLVHLYEEDPAFPAGLNGRFHGLLIDRHHGTVMLFNDRYGMHRIYYHESRDAFYFASEAKAILSIRPELRKINPRALGELISCGAVLENRTLFDGAYILPPGSAWMFENGSLNSKSSYFHPGEWEQQETLRAESFYNELRDVFARNLPRFFNGHQRVAMSLTGGLDTRMIMAWERPAAGSLPCYTFGGEFRECQDVTVARKVAQMCGQPHQVIQVGAEFLSRFPYYAERTVYLTDGCVDVGRAPDLYLNEKARQIAPVRMTGNYGGEILRRVRAFKATKSLQGLFDPDVFLYVEKAQETYSMLLLEHPVSFAAFKQGPWYHHGTLQLEQMQLSLRSPYLDNDFIRTVFRAPRPIFDSTEVSLRLIADGNRDLLRIPTDRGVSGTRSGMSAAASRGLLEFQFKAEYAYDAGMPQWVALIDHSFSSLHLERLFLGRHKLFHFRIWYRDVLASYVREMLLDPRSLSRPYINRKNVEAVVNHHTKGDKNYTMEIHKLLTLELVHRLFVSSN